jgi:HEAT repeat protein
MGSLTYFCPNCWVETCPHDSICPRCGFRLAAFDALGYAGKLLLALKHPIPGDRMLAIQLLGELKSRPAALALTTVIDVEEDPYALSAIVHALSQIGGAESWAVLGRLRLHQSVIVRNAIEEIDHAMT